MVGMTVLSSMMIRNELAREERRKKKESEGEYEYEYENEGGRADVCRVLRRKGRVPRSF